MGLIDPATYLVAGSIIESPALFLRPVLYCRCLRPWYQVYNSNAIQAYVRMDFVPVGEWMGNGLQNASGDARMTMNPGIFIVQKIFTW